MDSPWGYVKYIYFIKIGARVCGGNVPSRPVGPLGPFWVFFVLDNTNITY